MPSATLLKKSVTGVVLAGGRGSRMGRLKQLLPFRGKTIIQTVIDNALASRLQQVVVVLGHQADQIRRKVCLKQATVVVNENYCRGQSTSLQAGLAAIAKTADAVMFILGDQPLVGPAVIDRLIDEYVVSRALLVIPAVHGKRGNPVIVDRRIFSEINTLTGDTGARVLFNAHADRIREVAVSDSAIHFDIDTWEDYIQLKDWEK